jgi:hypothetical protein
LKVEFSLKTLVEKKKPHLFNKLTHWKSFFLNIKITIIKASKEQRRIEEEEEKKLRKFP